MISSFFNRTKPINMLFIVLYAVFFYGLTRFYLYKADWSAGALTGYAGQILVLVFSIFLISFIIRKNALCENNSYSALLFVAFMALFPQIFVSPEIIMANLFVLLALRRIISIRSFIQVKQKLFDASLWICVSALFYEWTLVFLLLVFAAIMVYRVGEYRNWLVPFVAVFVVGMLLLTYVIWFRDLHWVRETFPFSVDFYSIRTMTPGFISAVVLIVLTGLVSVISFITRYKTKPSGVQSSLLLIVIAMLLACGVASVSNNRESDEVVFALFPVAVLAANYLQEIVRPWWKESLLWFFVAAPFILLFIN
ncbi:DUF6427 family protein [Sinomicrobium soli]|uniref:DUF6427 family protein n=1 Tax=Sinomicrobium sp. N-1-3-6 TaxID=2219864 RepID=UPI000DCB1C71|nr:DUF6427 family protein [Sinomicrobium sp. N-1-3-6]RAV29401.1 hypothetical protein DN748_07805 [Sinomicrobium sp. N-1-3-6]